ncbi:MAG TPA: precorrin-8X methylmutase [Isosphaeraceae bacterium]|nr:precorrin-8X methylmutase [Isosphaeraceae bacterium]
MSASAAADSIGILIISHGSPRAEANQGFESMVARVASRLQGNRILPAFFSITRPDIPDQVAALVSQGINRILLLPHFLYSGQHVTVDIPALLDECRRRFPHIVLELLPTLENDPALEDLLVERLTPMAGSGAALPSEGAAIEQRSYEIIDRQLGDWGPADSGARRIIRRVVHATADISFARTLRIHPEAIERGRGALAAGRPVICDVTMLQAGLTKIRGEILCAIDRPEVTALAQAKGCTRAAAAMESLAPRLEGAIVAIGNAPTALWKVMELARHGGPRPAVVVGLPVGFVGARESKLALVASNLCYISNTSPRGGSPVAAAAVNALATLGEEK